jgi:hypothetical protein
MASERGVENLLPVFVSKAGQIGKNMAKLVRLLISR